MTGGVRCESRGEGFDRASERGVRPRPPPELLDRDAYLLARAGLAPARRARVRGV